MEHRRSLGKYQLVAELARGGMGLVYLASASGPGGFSKLFVIKELKPELAEDHGFLEMFLEEARLAARLNHPNIVTTYEVAIEGGRPYIVMDYLEGQTLARVLHRHIAGFSLEMHLLVLSRALDGLHYAHHQTNFDGSTTSIVHRDVSPQNVFITYDGQVKVVDFGIAKASDTTVETRTGVFKGKPAYMAPEQLHGDVTPRGDVYSVGVMLWEAIVGQRMWSNKSDVEVLTSLLKGDLPSIDEAAPDAPATLREICKKALSRDPAGRFDSAKEFRDALEGHLATRPRATLKDIGAAVAEGFTKQREKLRVLIELSVSAARSNAPAPSRSDMPSVAAETLSSRPSPARSTPMGPGERGERGATEHPVLSGTPAASSVQAPVEIQRSTRLFVAVVAVGAIAAVLLVCVGVLLSRTTGLSDRGSMTHAAGVEPRSAGGASAPAPAPGGADFAGVAPAVAHGAPDASTPTSDAAPSSSANGSSPPSPLVPRATPPRFVPPPSPPKTPAPTPPSPSANPDCNPPFFFEGTKKVFKPGCL